MAAEPKNTITKLPHWVQRILQIPRWAYLATLGGLGVVASLAFGVGVVVEWALLLLVLLAMGRAVIWAFKVSSFLLTPFFVSFFFIYYKEVHLLFWVKPTIDRTTTKNQNNTNNKTHSSINLTT